MGEPTNPEADFVKAVDDAVASAPSEADPTPAPSETPAPAEETKPEPTPEPEIDLSKNFKDAFGGWRDKIPESERAAYDRRVEQGGRWQEDGKKLKVAEASNEATRDYAVKRAAGYPGGQEYIETHGVAAALAEMDAADARAKTGQTPSETPEEVPEWAKPLVESNRQLTEKLDRMTHERGVNEQEARYNAEVNPAVDKALKDLGTPPEQIEAAKGELNQIVLNMYMAELHAVDGDFSRVVPTDSVNRAVAFIKRFSGTPGAAPTSSPTETVTPTVSAPPNPNGQPKDYRYEAGPESDFKESFDAAMKEAEKLGK